jgi:hypothetical protein
MVVTKFHSTRRDGFKVVAFVAEGHVDPIAVADYLALRTAYPAHPSRGFFNVQPLNRHVLFLLFENSTNLAVALRYKFFKLLIRSQNSLGASPEV